MKPKQFLAFYFVNCVLVYLAILLIQAIFVEGYKSESPFKDWPSTLGYLLLILALSLGAVFSFWVVERFLVRS